MTSLNKSRIYRVSLIILKTNTSLYIMKQLFACVFLILQSKIRPFKRMKSLITILMVGLACHSIAQPIPICGSMPSLSTSVGTSTTAMAISWDAITGANYRVTYSLVGNPPINSCSTTGTSCTITDLTPGTAYRYNVVASRTCKRFIRGQVEFDVETDSDG
jgi:hypothetical protein